MGILSHTKKETSSEMSSERKLQEFIELTKNEVITLSDSIDCVNLGIDDTLKNSTEINNLMTSVLSSTGGQISLVDRTTSMIEKLHKAVENIMISTNDVQSLAAGSNDAVINGQDCLNKYNATISVITESMQKTADFIGILHENVKDIVDTIDIIVRISNQLNMLSLNSAIEAARVGEAGRGFAVVAHEITDLSLDTKNGISKINSILGKIIESSENVESSINKSIKDFENGKKIFDQSMLSFENINEKNKAVLGQINDVSNEVNTISKITEETSRMINKVSDSADEISIKTKEVSEVVNAEQEEFQSISTTVDSLQRMLSKLESLINKYNDDIKPVPKKPLTPIKIAVICPFGHEFWLQIREGIMYAKKELLSRNCIVDFMPIEDLTLVNYTAAMRKCIDEKYNGISLVGYYEELASLVDEAASKKIPCITFNSEFEKASKRLTFVGQNAYESGVVSANALAEKINKIGNVVVVTSDKKITNHEIRRSGFNDTIAKYKGIKIVEVIEGHENNDEVYNMLDKCYKKNPIIDAIYITAGGQLGAAKWVEDRKLVGKTKIVLYDFMRNILELIAKGTVTAAIGQDPFRQGHDPVIYLYNNIVAGLVPPSENMWTRIDVVDKHNVDNYL